MNHWVPIEWTMAVRFLREGRLQTIFIIGGIAIGVGPGCRGTGPAR